MKNLKKINNPVYKKPVPLILLAAVALVTLAGITIYHFSSAASSYVSLEPEAGTVTAPAVKLTDAVASGGSVIKFGAAVMSSPTPTPTPSGSVKVIDSANIISNASWFTQAYNAGFRMYVLNTTDWGTCNPWAPAVTQIRDALAAGLKVGAYTRDPNCWKNGILATGQYQSQLQFFCLDVETDPGTKVTRAMVDGVKAMGVRPIIYAGSGMWPGVMGGNVTSFSDVPLWDTDTKAFNYATWQANILSPTPVQYGGWNTASTMRVGVQQQFEYNLNGVFVDLNSFDASFLR